MYTCGLTVYARGHIGNFRTFVCVDVLRRTLRHLLGYKLHHVLNFTDVDDRTIIGAQKANMDLRAYTDQYIAAFREDARALALEQVEENPRATDAENIAAMAAMIVQLEQKGHTYKSDGSIYFKISSMPDYGKLAHLDHAGMKPGARVDSDDYAKDDARDFVLWKATKPGEPTWEVSGVRGRPGWHLECSAMALRLLGQPPIDIHTGGIDLIFPHHENEIAQSECATGHQFSRFWFHVEHLIVDEQKMSKSLGNTHTIPDIIAAGHRPSAVRYLLLSAHYRKQLNFTWESLQQSEEALRRLTDFLARLVQLGTSGTDNGPGTGASATSSSHPDVLARVEEARAAFGAAMRDDLNTAAALGAVFELVRSLNSAIDAGQVGGETCRLSGRPSISSTRCSGSCRCAVRRTNSRRSRSEKSSSSSRHATPLAAAAISRPPTVCGTTWRHAACYWKIRQPARAGNASNRSRKTTRGSRRWSCPISERRFRVRKPPRSSPGTRPSSHRPIHAAIRS